ncbi:MAG: sensor histidine kinase KdpD [Polyangiaceae bacterium]
MSEPSERPDADALLRRVNEERARAKRGKLKLFFGFAPGVGKTYRMLQAARDLVEDQKLDVVVGVVEDHGRTETAELLEALEVLPRRKSEYRGVRLEELDLDGALARHPKLLLVDELAHTNAPGSRHRKRWQDVEEVLDAGIDVFSTMNVQHVESLNDVIAQITHVRVRETVPDSVLDHADAIELVDVPPEVLLERLRDGKVYLGEQAQRAADHFFRRGNLLALRELALRRTAERVDEDVREYRAEHGVHTTWPAGERVLVCVGPAPSSGRLIRAAARIAAGLRCAWVASYVEVPAVTRMSDGDRERLEAHFRLAEALGGTVTRLSGVRIAEALLVYARKHNVTRIVIGKPTHSRLRDRVRGSLLDEVVRGSGDIDVLVISGDTLDDEPAAGPRPAPTRSSVGSYFATLGVVAATLAVALGLRSFAGLPDPELLFLLAVMVVAVTLGRGPSIMAAALSVACYDFFFVPPRYTFSVWERRYLLTFAIMFGVGYAMSELAERLRRQERDALAREERTAVLYALTRELASTNQPSEIAIIAARHAADVFVAQAVVLAVSAEGLLQELAASPEHVTLAAADLGVAKWTYEREELAGFGTDTLPGSKVLCSPLRAGQSKLGVLALIPKQRSALGADQRMFLDVFSRQVAIALERARLFDEAKQAALRARTEEMRSSLLSAVSHDLRTPLASITGAATSLRDDPDLSQATRGDLVEAIVDQAARLERLVSNLLDMTRLESGGVALRRDWVPLDEIIGSALTRLEERLEARPVDVVIDEDVPLVFVDPVIYEQVFVNLLENADKYTGPGSPIEIRASRRGDLVVVEVRDHGPGLVKGTEARIFEKFFRGTHAGVSGAGLGLAICKGIVEAHGGTIEAENGVEDGATFRLTIPSGGEPPPLSLRGAAS